MATVNVYNVLWHFEIGGKNCSPTYETSVGASAQDAASIKTVLTNNASALATAGIQTAWPGGTLVIDSVQADPTGNQTIYT